MPERFSSIDKVVGSVSDDEKDQMSAIIEDRFRDHSSEKFLSSELLKYEVEKTPEQLDMIRSVNELTNNFLESMSYPTMDIPPDNVHIISSEGWSNPETDGKFSPLIQGVAIKDNEIKTIIFDKLIHEFLHMKSYGAIQADQEGFMAEYRMGLAAFDRNGEKLYLNNLSEGFIETLAKQLLSNCNDVALSEERDQFVAVKQKFSYATDENGKPALDDDDIMYASAYRHPDGSFDLSIIEYPYQAERYAFQILTAKIFQVNEGKISQEEIFAAFADGVFTGNLLTLGKMIENSFGKGTFRKIAEAGEDIEKLLEIIGNLK